MCREREVCGSSGGGGGGGGESGIPMYVHACILPLSLQNINLAT